jgi:signal transduction histidine kinase
MERLSDATHTIAKGTFDVQIDVASQDEIGALAQSFNHMASGLKERDEALDVAQSQLIQSEKMAAFGQLGAGIAHEVKNPLAGILGCTQVALLDAEPNSMLEGNLQMIEKETSRCADIINNLMKFARQEKAKLEPTQVNSVVADAIAIINHQLQMHQVKVIQDLDQQLDEIQGNSNQLQQVLMNLMINAQQAMEGDRGSVTVTTRQFDDAVEIRVRDDGPGIPAETLPKLFEPFFTTKATGKGTGLGLSVTYGIIQDHNGEITVESAVGNGTEFVIRLPKPGEAGTEAQPQA